MKPGKSGLRASLPACAHLRAGAPGFFLSVFLGLLYFRTLAPGLSWAFDGADGGDLVTAAAIGGVPHPTGYPTYMVLASGFLAIPVGSLAFRTNLLSLAAAVLAALVLYLMILALDGSVLAASVASLAFGTTPLIWSQAIITEVYTVQALFTVAFLFLLLVSPRRPRIDWLLGVTAGLCIGNHLTGILLLPLLLINRTTKNDSVAGTARSDWRRIATSGSVLIRRYVGVLAGLCIYLIIPFRAARQAAINWGNVHDLPSFAWLAFGKMYWGRLAKHSSIYLFSGLGAWARFLIEQFTILGLLLLLVGLIVLFKRSSLYVATIWIALAYSAFAIIYYSPDSYTLLAPALISFSIWLGLASRWLAELASRRISYGAAISISLILAFFLVRGLLSIRKMDLSADRGAEEYAQAILTTAPRDAILLAQGDEATFALWYFQYARRERPDVAIVANDLLVQPWYHDVVKHTYPNLLVPDLPWGQSLLLANPGRAGCRLAAGLQPRLECSG